MIKPRIFPEFAVVLLDDRKSSFIMTVSSKKQVSGERINNGSLDWATTTNNYKNTQVRIPDSRSANMTYTTSSSVKLFFVDPLHNRTIKFTIISHTFIKLILQNIIIRLSEYNY